MGTGICWLLPQAAFPSQIQAQGGARWQAGSKGTWPICQDPAHGASRLRLLHALRQGGLSRKGSGGATVPAAGFADRHGTLPRADPPPPRGSRLSCRQPRPGPPSPHEPMLPAGPEIARFTPESHSPWNYTQMMARVPGGSVPARTRGLCVINAPQQAACHLAQKRSARTPTITAPVTGGRSWGDRRALVPHHVLGVSLPAQNRERRSPMDGGS